MGNDLIVKGSGEMAEFAAEYLQEEGFSPDKLPKFTIGQGSPRVGKVGHFNLPDGQSFEKLERVSFISKHASRVLFYGRGVRNKNARCASDDGVNPAVARLELGPITNIRDGGCANCPAGMWSADGHDRDIFASEFKENLAKEIGYAKFDPTKPLCNYTENLIFLDKGGEPFVLQIMKQNIKPAEQMAMMIKTIALKMRTPGWALQFDLTLTPMSGEGNRHLLNFSKSKDWSSISVEVAKDRSFMVNLLKKTGAAMISAKHAAQDAAHIREAQTVPAPENETQDAPWPGDEQQETGEAPF